MPFLSRRRPEPSILPADIVQRIESYGRYQFSVSLGRPLADFQGYELIYQPLYPIAQADPDAFTSALAEAVLPVGGWAVYGGERCIQDLISANYQHPRFAAMIDAAMEFFRRQGYGTEFVAPYELAVWAELHPGTRW